MTDSGVRCIGSFELCLHLESIDVDVYRIEILDERINLPAGLVKSSEGREVGVVDCMRFFVWIGR